MRNNSKLFIVLTLVVLLVSSVPVAVTVSGAEIQSVDSNSSTFGYDSFAYEEQKAAYNSFAEAMKQIENDGMEGHKDIKMFDINVHDSDLMVVKYAYMSDHPETFWASYYEKLYTVDGKVVGLSIGDNYEALGKERISTMKTALENAVAKIDKSSGGMGDRMKYLNDAVAGRTDYKDDTKQYPNCGNAYGVFCDGHAKCDGYSLALNYLCQREGITCVTLVGYINDKGAEDGGHAWNVVKMDNDNWYYIDVTWNDTTERTQRYDYLLIGSQTGTPSGSFSSTRTVYYDYYITVSKDKYPYEAYTFWEKNMAVIAIAAIIAIMGLLFLFSRYRKKKRAMLLQAEIVEGISSGKICSQCGCPIPPDQDFCSACGKKAKGKDDQ